jgi:hypothetical protein
MIVLLDIRRGFDKSRHVATVDADLIHLQKNGLILDRDGDWVLSAKGTELIKAWEMCARGLR